MITTDGTCSPAQLSAEAYVLNPNPETLERVIENYKRLVYKIAQRYSGRAELDDLIGEGMIALIQALHHYDPKIAKFSTMATYYVNGILQRYSICKSKVINMPHWVIDFYAREARVIAELIAKGEEFDAAKVADKMGYTLEKYLEVVKNNPKPVREPLEDSYASTEPHSDKTNWNNNGKSGLHGFSINTYYDESREEFETLFNDCIGKSPLKVAQMYHCTMDTAISILDLLYLY